MHATIAPLSVPLSFIDLSSRAPPKKIAPLVTAMRQPITRAQAVFQADIDFVGGKEDDGEQAENWTTQVNVKITFGLIG